MVLWYDEITAQSTSSCKVILHEIGHGIGFYSVANLDQSGIGSFSHIIDPMVNIFASFPIPNLNGEPLIYDLFIENLQGQQLVDTNLFINPSISLTNQFTGNNLYFNGLNTVAQIINLVQGYIPLVLLPLDLVFTLK